MHISAREEFRQDVVKTTIEYPNLFAGWELKYEEAVEDKSASFITK